MLKSSLDVLPRSIRWSEALAAEKESQRGTGVSFFRDRVLMGSLEGHAR